MSTESGTPAQRSSGFFASVFLVAALYDLTLGLVFFFGYSQIYDVLNVPVPENTSYIHLSAAFVFVQGVGYWFVYRNMRRNVDIVRLGVIYKGVYSAVAVYYWATGGLPHAVFAWFAIFDVVFLALFVAFLASIRTTEQSTTAKA
jgi:hypothetical protein